MGSSKTFLSLIVGVGAENSRQDKTSMSALKNKTVRIKGELKLKVTTKEDSKRPEKVRIIEYFMYEGISNDVHLLPLDQHLPSPGEVFFLKFSIAHSSISTPDPELH